MVTLYDVVISLLSFLRILGEYVWQYHNDIASIITIGLYIQALASHRKRERDWRR